MADRKCPISVARMIAALAGGNFRPLQDDEKPAYDAASPAALIWYPTGFDDMVTVLIDPDPYDRDPLFQVFWDGSGPDTLYWIGALTLDQG